MTPTTRKTAQTATSRGEFTRLWENYEVVNQSAALAFETWLDDKLKRLEDQYCEFQTYRSVAVSLKR
jgi:hypothetical protein